MKDVEYEEKQNILQDLIQSAMSGNQDAIAELYNNTYNAVYHTIKSMIRDEDTVLDILQDSYVKGFQNLAQLNNPTQFQAWMKQIATNNTKNWIKKKKPVLFSELENEDGDMALDFEDERTENLPDVVIDQNETTRLVSEILDSLSDEQRLVVGMYYYEQMSVSEIAELLECSENTVKSRLNYARKKIKGKVEDLEKKGTKLYSLAPLPFLLLLLRELASQTAAIPAAILQGIQAQAAISTSAVVSGTAKATAKATAEAVTKSATKATAKAVAKTGMKAIIVKIAAAVTAAAVIGVGAFIALNNKSVRQDPQEGSYTSAPPVESPGFAETSAIDLKQYVSAHYDGISGFASAEFHFDREAFYGDVLSIYKEYADSADKQEALSALKDSLRCEPDYAYDLESGETVTVIIEYDKELAKELGISFENVQITFTVEELDSYISEVSQLTDTFLREIADRAYKDCVEYAIVELMDGSHFWSLWSAEFENIHVGDTAFMVASRDGTAVKCEYIFVPVYKTFVYSEWYEDGNDEPIVKIWDDTVSFFVFRDIILHPDGTISYDKDYVDVNGGFTDMDVANDIFLNDFRMSYDFIPVTMP